MTTTWRHDCGHTVAGLIPRPCPACGGHGHWASAPEGTPPCGCVAHKTPTPTETRAGQAALPAPPPFVAGPEVFAVGGLAPPTRVTLGNAPGRTGPATGDPSPTAPGIDFERVAGWDPSRADRGRHDGPCLNYVGQDPAHYNEHDSCALHIAASEQRWARIQAVIDYLLALALDAGIDGPRKRLLMAVDALDAPEATDG